MKDDTLTKNATLVNFNKFMDLVMVHFDAWIEQNDLLPMVLEDIREVLEYPSFLINLTGKLDLRNGFLTQLISVVRSGNAIMSYDQSNSLLRITSSVSVEQILVSTLMNLMLLWLVNSVIVSALFDNG